MSATTKGRRFQAEGFGGRFYEIDGRIYRSVTNALGALAKPALLWWAATQEREFLTRFAGRLVDEMDAGLFDIKQWDDRWGKGIADELGRRRAFQVTSKAAADIGTQAHGWIEWWMRKEMGQDAGLEPKLSAPAERAVVAFDDWRKEEEFRPLSTEVLVYHEDHGYAGTADFIGTLRGKFTVLGDIKTSKAIYADYYLQVAAYREAALSIGLKTDAGLILRLPKREEDGLTIEAREVKDHEAHFAAFLHLLAVAEWKEEFDK